MAVDDFGVAMSVDSSHPEQTPTREVVLIIARGSTGEKLSEHVAQNIGNQAEVVSVKSAKSAKSWLTKATSAEASGDDPTTSPIQVGLVIHLADEANSDRVMRELIELPGASNAKYLLVTDRAEHSDLSWIIDQDRLLGVLVLPWTPSRLTRILNSYLKRREEKVDWYRSHQTEFPAPRSKAAQSLEQKPPITPEKVESRLLENLALSPDDAMAELVEEIEKVIGPRPRIHVPPGVRITHEGDEMHSIMLVLHGRVSMTAQTRVGEVVLHHASTGPVIGLLSLADQRRSFATARTTTDCVLVHLTTQQLDFALEESPRVGVALTAVSIRVLSMRLRRSQNLIVEKFELAAQLNEEREHLAEALTALENARTQLIAQARFATLGELSAGIAHELNNPIAAMSRAGDHLYQEIMRLIKTHPRKNLLVSAINNALTAPRGSAAAQRAWRREVEQVVKDRDLARRLVSAGIRDKASAKAARKHVELVEIAAGIGNSLRNLQQGGEHVVSLVESLRAHARPETVEKMDVDVVASLERAVRLTGHRLQDVKVTWKVTDDIPTVLAHPASLAQVWTNQLVNAADATAETEDDPQIRLVVRTVGTRGKDLAVQVKIIDNGPGIAPEILDRIFQPQFTTKYGTVRYGLGMGLGISRRIVENLGGTLIATSKPGKTAFITTLPVDPGARIKEASSPVPAQSATVEPDTSPFGNRLPLPHETGMFAAIKPDHIEEKD